MWAEESNSVPICIFSFMYQREHFSLLSEDWTSSAYEYQKELDSTLKSTEVGLLCFSCLYYNFWCNLCVDKEGSFCSEQCETWVSGSCFFLPFYLNSLWWSKRPGCFSSVQSPCELLHWIFLFNNIECKLQGGDAFFFFSQLDWLFFFSRFGNPHLRQQCSGEKNVEVMFSLNVWDSKGCKLGNTWQSQEMVVYSLQLALQVGETQILLRGPLCF